MLEPRHPLYELTRARIVEMVREPAVMFWVFGFPVLLAVGLGLAFREKGPEKNVVAVVDSDRARAAMKVLEKLEGVELLVMSEPQAQTALRKARADLVLEFSTTSSLADASRLIYDPSDPKSLAAKLSVERALDDLVSPRPREQRQHVHVAEKGHRYIDYLLPGLFGLNLMGSSMWGIGYAIVENRSKRLMKRFAATPMRRSYYLLSFILSRLMILLAEMVLLFAFGSIAFGVEIRGHIGTLVLMAMSGSLSFAGVALAIAARPSKTEVASGWMNAVMMPMWILSGVFFSYERFPEVTLPLIRALPLTALNDGLRQVVNEGASLGECFGPLAVLSAWGAAGFLFALKYFRWTD